MKSGESLGDRGGIFCAVVYVAMGPGDGTRAMGPGTMELE
jgi:hypothetical protein